MINAKGETIYTNAEIAYELGLTAHGIPELPYNPNKVGD